MSSSSQLPSWASSSTSIRLAPAEKFGASLPITRAWPLFAASLTPACSIWMVSPPMAFIFEWNSTAITPSPMSTRLAPEFFLMTRPCSFAVRRICRSGAAGVTRPSRNRERPPSSRLLIRGGTPRWHGVAAGGLRRGQHFFHADDVEQLEGSEVPAESPTHHAVDIVDRMGDLRRDARGIDERRRQRGPQEFAGLVFRVEQHPHALGDIVHRLARFNRGDARGLFRPVLEGGRIERPDFAFARGVLAPLVEALAGLFAEGATLDQLLDERMHREGGAIGLVRQALVEVPQHVREHVDAGDIHGPERGAARTAKRGPGDRVDLFDRVLPAGEHLQRSGHAVQARCDCR